MNSSVNDTYTPHERGPLTIVVVKIVLVALSSVVTLVGNTIILLIIARNKKMWNSTNYYIANLAVCDLCVAAFVEWTSLVHHLNGYWPFGRFLCTFCLTIQGVLVICSILTLTVIAGDRFFAIIFPLKWRETKARTCIIAIVIVWGVSVCINIPLLIVVEYEEWRNDDINITFEICWENWMPMSARNDYTIALFVFTYILPLIIMLFAYGSIGRKLWTKKRPSTKRKDSTSNMDRAKRKVIKMLLAVVSAFAFCWFPFQFYVVIDDNIPEEHRLNRDYRKHVRFFFLWIGYANSAMNPIIYCGFNDSYRKNFAAMFTFSWCPKWLTGNTAPDGKVQRGPSSYTNQTGATKESKKKPKLALAVNTAPTNGINKADTPLQQQPKNTEQTETLLENTEQTKTLLDNTPNVNEQNTKNEPNHNMEEFHNLTESVV
ncbi:QRFP-like peptide receptor [Glandiceps talaboti]